jgi:phosphoribosylaminoimidazole-succinocarboxamide synthase
MSILLKTELPLTLSYSGKVRDTYELDDKLLLIATDRISAFDVVLPCGIPDKGLVLNQISTFWFEKTEHIVPNHVIAEIASMDILMNYIPAKTVLPEYLIGRSMIVHKAERLPVEAIVRGYLSGSAWVEYKESGTIGGIKQIKGLEESQELPQSLFTPTTKADSGHDMPITKQELNDLIGEDIANELEEKSLTIYEYARDYARNHGIIVADTKFEFGFINGQLSLIDELLTPDSSRFWDANIYKVGQSQPSYDKQPIRDWLADSGWNKEPPAPALPQTVIDTTTLRYTQVFNRLTGLRLIK